MNRHLVKTSVSGITRTFQKLDLASCIDGFVVEATVHLHLGLLFQYQRFKSLVAAAAREVAELVHSSWPAPSLSSDTLSLGLKVGIFLL